MRRSVRARELAEKAAQAAQEAAAEATREAERLAEEARARAAEAERRAAAASEVRDRAQRRVERRPQRWLVPHRDPPSGSHNGLGRTALTALTKQDLLRLAEQAEIDGRSAMSKPQLVGALARQHLPLDTLTKHDLLTIGEGNGADIRVSMSKDELIKAISTTATDATHDHRRVMTCD